MEAYLNLLSKIIAEGDRRPNRTGVDTIAIPGAMFEHHMSEGFPLLTTKTVPLRLVASELEFFIKGLTDKRWLQERDNHIWDDWARQDKIKYANKDDPEQQEKMRAENDLGPIYGWQWRHFGASYPKADSDEEIGKPGGPGIDQFAALVQKLHKDPTDRRMIVSAWNPMDMRKMGLPACHYAFQVLVIGGKLNLLWNQRSVDSVLGLPFNIASYALLLHLLSKESGFPEGKLIGMLGDTHIYVNHQEGIREQMTREPYPLPRVETENFTSIFNWVHTDTVVQNYEHHPKIKFDIAV